MDVCVYIQVAYLSRQGVVQQSGSLTEAPLVLHHSE